MRKVSGLSEPPVSYRQGGKKIKSFQSLAPNVTLVQRRGQAGACHRMSDNLPWRKGSGEQELGKALLLVLLSPVACYRKLLLFYQCSVVILCDGSSLSCPVFWHPGFSQALGKYKTVLVSKAFGNWMKNNIDILIYFLTLTLYSILLYSGGSFYYKKEGEKIIRNQGFRKYNILWDWQLITAIVNLVLTLQTQLPVLYEEKHLQFIHMH